MRKFVFVLVMVVLAVLAFPKDVLVLGTTDKLTTIDPAKAYDFMTCNLLQNIMVGLVDYKVGTLEIVPALAEKWDISDDGIVYTFYLRKDAKFEDGTPITAQVFKYSFDRVAKLEGDPAFLITDIVEKTEVVDDYTFRIYLKYPFSAFLSILAFTAAYPVNPNVYPEDSFLKGDPIGSASGPYRIKEHVRDVKIVLEANPMYFGEKPKTKTIVINFYETSATLRMALETGEIDMIYKGISPVDLEGLKKNPDVKVYMSASPKIRYLVINVKKPPFDNLNVRKAIAYAVDRQKIIDYVFPGLASPLYSMIPAGMWSHKDVFPKYDPDKARELLRKEGYSMSNPLVVDLWYTPTHYGDTEADVAQVIKESLEDTGIIKVNIKYAEWATYIEYFLNGTMPIFLLGWYPDYMDPDDYVWPFLSISGAKSLGSFYECPEVEKIMKEARKEVDVKKRTELYYKVQDILARDIPYIPLWQDMVYVAARKSVKGVLLEATKHVRLYLLYSE